jgi:hypothetical protein
MPIKDGYETAIELNELFDKYPEYKCPIIACTGNVSLENIKVCKDSGIAK